MIVPQYLGKWCGVDFYVGESTAPFATIGGTASISSMTSTAALADGLDILLTEDQHRELVDDLQRNGAVRTWTTDP